MASTSTSPYTEATPSVLLEAKIGCTPSFQTKTDATNRTTKIFHWENISHKYPDFQKKVQTKNPYALEPLINVGAWIFEELDDKGLLQVSYYICSHPGGSVPVALQSIATENTLPYNIKDILIEGKKRSK